MHSVLLRVAGVIRKGLDSIRSPRCHSDSRWFTPGNIRVILVRLGLVVRAYVSPGSFVFVWGYSGAHKCPLVHSVWRGFTWGHVVVTGFIWNRECFVGSA